jgi:hypothetical protein
MLEVKSKAFFARLPELSDAERARVDAWTAQHCARGAVVTIDRALYLVAQREAARTAKMTCRLMRAALKRCGVTPDRKRWLALMGAEELETILQRCAPQIHEPVQSAAPADEDRVVQLPSRTRRSALAVSAPAASASTASAETDDGSRLIAVKGVH